MDWKNQKRTSEKKTTEDEDEVNLSLNSELGTFLDELVLAEMPQEDRREFKDVQDVIVQKELHRSGWTLAQQVLAAEKKLNSKKETKKKTSRAKAKAKAKPKGKARPMKQKSPFAQNMAAARASHSRRPKTRSAAAGGESGVKRKREPSPSPSPSGEAKVVTGLQWWRSVSQKVLMFFCGGKNPVVCVGSDLSLWIIMAGSQ